MRNTEITEIQSSHVMLKPKKKLSGFMIILCTYIAAQRSPIDEVGVEFH